MNDQTLIDALDQSIQWLAEGRTVADCVRAYPDLAEPLTSLLTTGMVVKRIQIRQSEISAAQDRVRLRLQARRQRWTQTRLLLRGVAAVLIVSLGVFLFGQAPSIATLLNQFQATTTPTLTLTTTTMPTVSQTASASITLTQTAMPSATPTLTASVTATATLTNTPELQPPIIQVTRYTTPTVIRATLPRTVPPTSRPQQATATPPPAATDDHGGSGSGTDDHGGGGSGKG